MADLVSQQSGAPTRKVFGSMLVAMGMVALNKSLPVLAPSVLAHPAVAPLYAELLTWAPMIVAASGYQLKEWGSA